jgi:hypothetical protein
MNEKEFGRRLSQYSHGITEEKHEKLRKDRRCPGRDSNWTPPILELFRFTNMFNQMKSWFQKSLNGCNINSEYTEGLFVDNVHWNGNMLKYFAEMSKTFLLVTDKNENFPEIRLNTLTWSLVMQCVYTSWPEVLFNGYDGAHKCVYIKRTARSYHKKQGENLHSCPSHKVSECYVKIYIIFWDAQYLERTKQNQTTNCYRLVYRKVCG